MARSKRDERRASSRKETQRQRLLEGMVAATNRAGYAGATVSAVIGHAGVSRPTFYDYFSDRDDCLHATIEHVQKEVFAAVADALGQRAPAEALAGAVEAVVNYAVAQPAKARFLASGAMAGGTAALDARDRGTAELAAAVRDAEAGIEPAALAPDLDARVALGGVYRMLGTRLRRGETALSLLGPEVGAWLASYRRPAGKRRWLELQPWPSPPRSRHVPDPPVHVMGTTRGRGRPREPGHEIAEYQRQRILDATARLAVKQGYTETTVADVTRTARVDGRTFYRLFEDKHDAFATVHELGFQHVMDVTAKAYFAVDGWPSRSWEGARALTQLLDENPALAHVGFVEAYAIGPSTVQRVEDGHVAFLFFLQEGLAQSARSDGPSRVAMEAVVAAVFEIVYLCTRHRPERPLAGMLAPIAHVWLTPFMGSADVDAFIRRRGGERTQRRRAPARQRPARTRI